MYGFKKGAKPEQKEKLRNGGMIQGPGTGTSDSIKAEIPKGSYIMPADSTQQIGPQALGKLGKPVPASVSNGEYQMPPEQVHAVGIQALNQMRDATHMPTAAGFKPQKDGLYFADGGSPAEEERKRLAGAGPSPQMGAIARGNQARVERTGGEGMYSQANAEIGSAMNYLNRGDPVKDAVNAIGGFFSRSAQQARGASYGGQPETEAAPQPVAAQPATTPPSAAPSTPAGDAQSTPAASQAAPAAAAPTRQPMQGPALGMRVRPTSAPEINRIDNAPGLNSPLFTNLPAGEAVSGMQGGTVNTVPASAMRSAGPQASAAMSSALQAAAARGDWDAVRGFYQRDGGTWQGRTAAQDAANQGPSVTVIGDSRPERDRYGDLMKEVAKLSQGGRAGRNKAAALVSAYAAAQRGEEADMRDQAGMRELGFRQQDAATRNALAAREIQERSADRTGRFALDERRLASDERMRGFEARGLGRTEKLYSAYENAKTPEERSAIAEQIRALSGKDTPNRYTVVPGGQEVTEQGMLRTVPSRVLNNQTGQLVDLSGQGAQALPPIAENPAVQRIMQNTALSREERAAQIRALGYK